MCPPQEAHEGLQLREGGATNDLYHPPGDRDQLRLSMLSLFHVAVVVTQELCALTPRVVQSVWSVEGRTSTDPTVLTAARTGNGSTTTCKGSGLTTPMDTPHHVQTIDLLRNVSMYVLIPPKFLGQDDIWVSRVRLNHSTTHLLQTPTRHQPFLLQECHQVRNSGKGGLFHLCGRVSFGHNDRQTLHKRAKVAGLCHGHG